MAHRPSNRQRSAWAVSLLEVRPTDRRLARDGRIAVVSQPRCPGASADTSRRAAGEIADLLGAAGFTHLRTEFLPLGPPVAGVLAGLG
jgi:hypothetical protein